MKPKEDIPGGKSQRRARGSLSREEILNAAAQLVRDHTVESFSMPILARSLNTSAMSIYRYFKSRDELFDALADRALVNVYMRLPPIRNTSWEEKSKSLSQSLHKELLEDGLYLQLCRSHPGALTLRPDVVPFIARRLETELEGFEDTALDISDAVRFLVVLSAYTRGFALMQRASEGEVRDHTSEEEVFTAFGQLDLSEVPTVKSLSNVGAVIAVNDENFDMALEFLVSGMQAFLDPLGSDPGSDGEPERYGRPEL